MPTTNNETPQTSYKNSKVFKRKMKGNIWNQSKENIK